MLMNTMGNGRPALKRAGELIRSLWRDRRGAVTIYVAASMPVLLGIGAISFDLGRLMTVNTELQSAADAAAMAGAAELDQKLGARDNARAAAAGAVANLQTFATGAADVAIDTTDCALPPVAPCIRFLKKLPLSDGDPIVEKDLAKTDIEARFIDVHVASRTVTNGLIRIVGGPAVAATSASAVAGNQYVVCGLPMMFMCNPSEPDGNTDLDLPIDFALLEGKQMELFHQGGGGTLTPGDFGLLCPLGTEGDNDCGGSDVMKALASTSGHCAALVTTKTGATLSQVRTGINVRFDFFTQQAKSNGVPWRDLDKYVPAASVTQGGEMDVNNATRCEYDPLPATQALGLPRDQCHIDNDCEVTGPIAGNPRVGDGSWDYREYFRINHGCDQNANPNCKPADWGAFTTGATWPPTRYEVYRYELEKMPEQIVMPGQTIYDAAGNPVETTAENGHTQCFQGTPPAIPGYNYFPAKVRDATLLGDRRILPFAVLNCNALDAAGFDTTGKFTVATDNLAYVFLTQPMSDPSGAELYGEVLAPMDEATVDSMTRIMLQLYRRS